MTKYNAAILEVAGSQLGQAEIPGARHNPVILKMFAESGHDWVQDDETPWCAAYVNAVLGSLGLPHTGKLNARSYETYGTEVSVQNAIPGDIVVFWRGSPNSWQGHVAFLVKFDGDKVIVRGGNQGDKVSDAAYPTSRIVAIRRADGRAAQPSRPTLRSGARGAFVLDLQDQLQRLRYFLGRVDGMFGPLTREALLAFQADHGLSVDGIVGPQTWEALQKAHARQLREVTSEDLDKSRTMRDADRVSTAAGATVAVAGLGTAIEVMQMADEAEGALATAQHVLFEYWPILVVMVFALMIWRYAERIKTWRIEDARTGRNLGR